MISKIKLETFLENIPGIVFICDVNERFTFSYINDYIQKINGLTAKQTLKKELGITDLFHPDDNKFIISEIKTSLQNKKPFRVIAKTENINKEQIWLEINGIKIKEVGEDYIQGVILDITQQKNLETELLNEKEKAEIANRTKIKFLANMSHELRTPLNGVTGMAQLLSMTDLSVEQKEFLDMLNYSSTILGNIINDILIFSDAEYGRITINKIPFNLKELVTGIYRISKLQATEKNLQFNLKIGSDFNYMVISDPPKITQIFLRLISNAIKFTEAGAVNVSLEEIFNDGKNATIRLSVEDTGIGISKDKQEILFDSFFQIDLSEKKSFQGTGLGLSIVKKIIDLLEAKIHIESNPDEGSRFIVDIPLEIETERQIQKSYKEKVNKILVVEDDIINQKLFQNLLTMRGYETEIVKNGDTAIELLEKNEYLLVIMDIMLFGLNGIDATKKIREREKDTGEHIPIIAVTAYSLNADRANCLEAGMDDYLPKPFEMDGFFNLIDKYIRK